jgi:hypothetical protein
MKIVLIGDADDVRGALLAGASFCRTREEASADPEVGLILEPEKGDDDAAAGQPGRGVRRGA